MHGNATEEGPGPSEAELVFQQAVEGLFNVGLRGRVTQELRARLREQGLDLAQRMQPAYPRQQWNAFVRVAAETLWPGEPPEAAYRALGRRLVLGYGETLVGRAIKGMLKVIGPRRTLERMTRNFRSGGNYNECSVNSVEATEILFWINEPYIHAAYMAGALEAALELAGARGIHVEVAARDARGCTYRVSWATA